ncbi:PilZ domain protein [Tsuneonella dongtanensis]|uniref:PilZ domain protein n=1 Tax=Tsuneonella dongtanensis TaxID=692370 RepID=A0A1B2A942_9SPHN|nr:PilZ domain-containing protein [Tsuneonella dongtanensis]ANY18693.1 PilZ domain protein [Tsuneonella dongtanensis]
MSSQQSKSFDEVADAMGAVCDRRSADRIESDACAIARIPASPHRVELVDVSRTGCRIRTMDGIAVPQGSTVHLDFGPGRRLTGQVMWSAARSAGVRFHQSLSGPLAATLGVEPAVDINVEAETEVRRGPLGPASLLPHWLRRLLRKAA